MDKRKIVQTKNKILIWTKNIFKPVKNYVK